MLSIEIVTDYLIYITAEYRVPKLGTFLSIAMNDCIPKKLKYLSARELKFLQNRLLDFGSHRNNLKKLLQKK